MINPLLSIFLLLIAQLLLLIWIIPFIGISLAVFLDLYFSYINLMAVPPRNYLIIYLFPILIARQIIAPIVLSKKVLFVLAIFLYYITWTVIISYFNGTPINALLYGVGRKFIPPLLIVLCVVLIVRDVSKLKLLIYLMIGGLVISAIVGIGQFFDIDLFWKLRASLGYGGDKIVESQIFYRLKVPGLAFYSITFSYQLSSVIPLTFGVLVNSAKKNFMLWISVIIMLAALFMTLTKSAILGAILGIVIIIMLTNLKHKKFYVVLVGLIITTIFFSFEIINQRFLKPDSIAYARIPEAILAVKTFADYPMGVGIGNYENIYTSYFSSVAGMEGAEVAFTNRAHNQFLNVACDTGIPGLLLLLGLYWQIFRNLNRLRLKLQSPMLKGVCIGLIGTFVSYIVNSFFHNAGPFLGDAFNWYFIGMVLVLIQISMMYENA